MTCSINRNQRLSCIRVIACFAIIVLHTVFAANEYFAEGLTAAENFVSRVVENNMMWAVPSFVMVTGALQLDRCRTLTYRKLYGKYVLRIAIALLACCILFRTFDILMDGETFSIGSLCKGFEELLTGRCWGHLWYLYLLLGLYVMLPFYRSIASHCSDKDLLYLSGAYVLFVSIIPLIEECGVPIGFYISESIIYPLYLFLGHMIYEKRVQIGAKAALLMVIASTVCIVLLDDLKYVEFMNLPDGLFGYSSPLVIAQTTGLFALICRHQGNGWSRCRQWISAIDGCTFGVYLIHMIFVRLLFRYWGINPYDGITCLILPGIIIAIFLMSLIITWLLRKIPGVRKVL